MESIFGSATWITASEFAALEKLDLLSKEVDKKKPVYDNRYLNRHFIFKKTFYCDKTSGAALYISADDYYKLYINGTFVAMGPAQAHYTKYNYNKLPVSKYLSEGENTVEIHVMYQGLVNRVYNSADNRMGVIASLIIGGCEILKTDESWQVKVINRYTSKECFGYDTQFKEDIDNTLPDSDFEPAMLFTDGGYTFSDSPVKPVSVEKAEIPCVKHEKNCIFIDFEKEITANVDLKLTAKADGAKLDIYYGEELTDNGDIYCPLRCGCDYHDTYTAKLGENYFAPYEYKAFRYVKIVYDENILIDTDGITVMTRHYYVPKNPYRFCSSDKLLESIWNICANAVICGTQETFVDCPTREKGQYLGDAFVTAQAQSYLTGSFDMYEKCLADFAESTRVCPGMMAVWPGNFMQEIADFSLIYPIMLYKYYLRSGNEELTKKYLPVAHNIVRHFAKYADNDMMLIHVSDKWNLVDWPKNLRDGYDFPTDRDVLGEGAHTVINAFYVGAVGMLTSLHNKLNNSDIHIEHDKLKLAFINRFYDSEAHLFKDGDGTRHHSLHANALALYFKLYPDDICKNTIIEMIEKKGLNCGVYFSYFVLKALCDSGRHDIAYKLIVADDIHSWRNMINEDATACFEAWGKGQKWNTSLCHPWASAPIIVLIEDLIGIRPAVAGYAQTEFVPVLQNYVAELYLKFSSDDKVFESVITDGLAKISVLGDSVLKSTTK